jgi:hypothetical protein
MRTKSRRESGDGGQADIIEPTGLNYLEFGFPASREGLFWQPFGKERPVQCVGRETPAVPLLDRVWGNKRHLTWTVRSK